MSVTWACVAAIVIGACAAPPASECIRTAAIIAAEGAMTQRRFQTERFSLLGYWRPASLPGAGLRVYLEGDGLAWLSRSQISSDPTPVDPLALRMAASDPSGRRSSTWRALASMSTPAIHTALPRSGRTDAFRWKSPVRPVRQSTA